MSDQDSNLIDAAILAQVRAGISFTVHDGWFRPVPSVGANPLEPVVIPVEIPLPYANFMSSFGDDDEPRLNGRNAQREKFFRLFHVGISREQVVGAIGKTRARLEGHRLVVDGRPRGLIKVDSSPLIFRDDGAVRADGKPLFSGIDNYTLRTSIQRS
jgi:hypothetical protein